MTTTAQQALTDFEKAWLTIDWSAMTNTQKQTHVLNHYGLKIAAAKEIEANRIESENQAVIDNAAFKQKAITYLQNKGFAVDNSLSDWQKLYNHPRIFGANWMSMANYQFSQSTGIDYFIQVAYQLWQEFVNNKEV